LSWLLPLTALLAIIAAPPARANHLQMALSVQGTQSEAKSETDQSPPPEGVRPRPVVKLKAGETLQVRWFVKNVDRVPVKDMVVHFFVAPEEKAGQKGVPDPRQEVVAENAFAIELAPGASTHGSLRLPIREPGTYLVRIESLYTQRDHEHFTAIDVIVERPAES
jgi:hypothetical protein